MPIIMLHAFLQLVWVDSTMIGCGVAMCPNISGFGIPDVVLLVCNYGPKYVNDTYVYSQSVVIVPF